MNLRKSAVFCENLRFGLSLSQGVFIEKGHGKGASRAPQTPHEAPPPGPSPQGCLLLKIRGGGVSQKRGGGGPGRGGGSVWNLGIARGPFTVKKRKALLFPPLLNNVRTRERKGYERGTARNFRHSFPSSGTPVVQSYWAWTYPLN